MKSELKELERQELKAINGGGYYKRHYFDWDRMEWRLRVIWKDEGELR